MENFATPLLEQLSVLMQDYRGFAPFFAFLAGILTSLAPCALSNVPLVIAYVGGTGRQSPARAFRFSFVFALGMALTFTALGISASLLGRLVAFGAGNWWYLFLGALMIAMALQIWGLVTIIPASYAQSKNVRRGYAGAFITGILGGLFSSPCATPVLVVLLALVAGSGNLAWGALLLLLYSAGHTLLVVFVGSSVGLTSRITSNERFGRISKWINRVLGFAILLVGLYLLYLGF